ncbi:AMP-binding protein [Coraliomargarita akajimensis]|uniref:AMP-dependent synthetase and ligase n=1 Tax=Coraliomargarita akajimensis (strain DSM 45221 / IAM 15411 / JCM 23193 / KCTC 12865 / 04OKA010-24) TaxID=583355 RepID=D5EK57_CORAD|nr:AMP-binding protein [Coraliomargarita akajimensis]ADE54806.1 AMP-dependent synthetase and ligase [Coraliomargarita akajimensis DSM 45221]
MTAPLTLDIGEAEFQQRPELKSHLAWECFTALASKPGRVAITDRTLQRREMKSGFLLALAWMLSRKLQKATQQKRVGIVFPPGIGATVSNLAVVFAGKVPVNMNFTLGPASIEACFKRAEVDCILTAAAVQAKMPAFPWPESGVLDVVDALKSISKPRTLALVAATYVMPSRLLAKLLKVPANGDREEAGLLFTSGSSGEPKGVVLSHRNVLGNCLQIDTSGLLPSGEVLVANLPVFHSFGFTVTLWYPLLRNCGVVTLPSPLEVKKVADAIEAESATVLIGTPTFLKPYLKRVDAKQLETLRFVVGGAEKTPDGFAALWKERFGSEYLEGYGLTEMSPVVGCNLFDKPLSSDYPGDSEEGARAGSIGRLFPGQQARILNPDTMEPQPIDQAGLLALRGPNVFEGYLGEPERTAEVMRDGWFITGDLARIDADGFVFIEGRLSRFSKIGGEMVPHGTIEEALIEAFDLLDAERPMLAIGSRPDPAKGEALVLLSAMPLELSAVRDALVEAGFANLWIPKEIVQVDAIPTLATGKLDLRGIRELSLG